MPKRKRIPRATLPRFTDAAMQADLRSRIPEGSPAFAYFNSVCLEPVEGSSEFERGKREGRRELAGEVLSISLNEGVEVNAAN